MDLFTPKAKHIMSLAQKEAEKLRQERIGTEHFLLALMLDEDGIANRVLNALLSTEPSYEDVFKLVEKQTGTGEHTGAVTLGMDAQQMLEIAIREGKRSTSGQVGTEHILVAITLNEECTGMLILSLMGLTPEQIRRQVGRTIAEMKKEQEDDAPIAPQRELPLRQSSRKRAEKDQGKTPLVDQLATDLTSKAEEGKLDPVIGRQKEIERVLQILARRTKNNPA